MKIVLFTPAIQTSAIGRMAALISRTLITQGHGVTVVRTEDESLLTCPTHSFEAPLIFWHDSPSVIHAADQADVLVYQIGDNYLFHGGCLAWLPRLPGIVCLHDFFLVNLFCGWAQSNFEEAIAIVCNWYGAQAAEQFVHARSSENLIGAMHDVAPMTEWISAMADGVIAHSHWGVQRVLNACAGSVHVVPLAYDVAKMEFNHGDSDEQYSNDEFDPTSFNLLTIGYANPNKRIASVIQAIGKHPTLRQHTIYRLVGAIKPEVADELMTLAEQCQVQLVISGEVDSQTLHQAIMQADVISCLRWPSLEGASASAIEAMLYGKPLIVTDTGFYREIPDTCAKKIDPHNELNALGTALEQLYTDVEQRQALGVAAQQWASATFTPEQYVRKLLAMATAIHQNQPILAAAKTHATVLKQWGADVDLITHSETLQPLNIFNK